jgi:hypothetical protein
VANSANIDDQELRDILLAANTSNLMSYREWAEQQSQTVCGVDILSSLSYDIIQIMNHNFLPWFLEGQKANA